mmetsp:Transcript_17991/g.42022  ORF Transcript_17991/g.42022 Transcript_17991/m.42022 type:complete len:384 (+) Transcript_17991:188-1339(+)
MPGAKTPPSFRHAQFDTENAANARLQKFRFFMLVIGTLMLVIMVLVPIRDAIHLMLDAVCVYFIGMQLPIAIIGVCAGAVLLWIVLVLLLFGCMSAETLTQNVVFMLVSLVITTLGLSLMLLSVPLERQANTAYNEIFFQCPTGAQTKDLHAYYTVLENIRNNDSCLVMTSVEQCEGYAPLQPYTGFLMGMEYNHRCAGFCSSLASANATADTEERLRREGQLGSSISLLQADSTVRKEGDHTVAALAELDFAPDKLAGMLRQVAIDPQHRSQSRRTRGQRSTPQVSALATDTVVKFPVTRPEYMSSPPALFSQASYQASCDGVAARSLKFGAVGTAEVMYYEGLFLIVCNLMATMVFFIGLCKFPRMQAANPKGGAEANRGG